jgi:hypothetical protein
MSTWAVLAAKQIVIATGFGAGLVPVIGTGSLDGFVIGAAMSGACFTALRRARRRATAATAATVATAVAGGTAPAAPAAGGTAATAPGGAVAPDAADARRAALMRRYFLAAERFESERGRQASADQGTDQGQEDSRQGGYVSRWSQDSQGAGSYARPHQLGEGNAIRQPRQETRRTPKHAAPPASFARKIAGIFANRGVLTAGPASRAS